MYFPHRIGEFPLPGVVTDPHRRNSGTGFEISLSPFSLPVGSMEYLFDKKPQQEKVAWKEKA